VTKFTVSRPVLAVLADRAGSVVPSSSGYQSSVHNLRIQVTASPPALRFTGTDMEVTVVTSTPAVQVAEPGEILVEARKFLELVKVAEGDEVTVATWEDAKGRRSIRVTCGTSWNLRLRDETYPAIPEIPAGAWRSVSREHLTGAIRTVRHAASKNGSYPAYACVAILPDLETPGADGKFRTLVMASDMSRSQYAEIPQVVKDGKAAAGFPFACAIPAAGGAVSEVLKVLNAVDLADADVAETENALAFRVGSTTIMVVKMHTRPANVKRTMERATIRNTLGLSVSRDELASAVRKVRVTADTTTPVIGLRAGDGKLTVLAQDRNGNNSEQEIKAGWAGTDEMLLLVNASFLTDMLAAHPSGSCDFLVAPVAKDKRKSEIMLRDEVSGTTGIIPQMANDAARLGYE
jgi:DNA polymerase III sliding clamp (beta) subunit (PCNA family)